VGDSPFRDVLVGEEVLVVQGLVEFLQHLARVDQGFEPGALDEMLFVALPADAVNEEINQGSVFTKAAPEELYRLSWINIFEFRVKD
jgi:hypothetical protein